MFYILLLCPDLLEGLCIGLVNLAALATVTFVSQHTKKFGIKAHA